MLEALPEFLPAADQAISREALKVLRKQGLDIRLNTTVTAAETTKDLVRVSCTREGKDEQLEFDRLIVAVGRRPNTEGLGAEATGLKLDRRGFIEIDENNRTSLDKVWAIGDVVHGPMLAHKASEEGVAVAERIAGQEPVLDHALIPWVIYTWPEIAWVGATEQSLTAAGRSVSSGTFPFIASGRARAMGETDGFVKVVADAQTDEILGVHIFGAGASELISEAVTAMAFCASSEDIARIVHAHPTMSEATHEAALAVSGRTLHI